MPKSLPVMRVHVCESYVVLDPHSVGHDHLEDGRSASPLLTVFHVGCLSY